jgi:excisionase family DNA binding protein
MTEQSSKAARHRSTGEKKRATVSPVAMSAEVFGEPLYTVQQAAEAMGVSAETLRDWIKAGDVMALRFGGKEFRITQSALRQYKEDREAAARDEHEQRRAERRLDAELNARRQREPWANWGRAFCPGCGEHPMLTTRQDRKEAAFICESCYSRFEAVGGYGQRNVIERSVRIKLDEYNAEVGAASRWPAYYLYRCGACERPQMLSAEQVRDLEFYPRCSHTWVDPEDRPDDDHGSMNGHYDLRVLRALAELEVQARAAEWCDYHDETSLAISPYMIAECPMCERNPIVVSRDAPMHIVVFCRECLRKQKAETAWDTVEF